MATIKNQKVKVSYPDGKGGHITTVDDVQKKWEKRGEDKVWIENFINQLTRTGIAYSRFGTYEIVSRLPHKQN